MNASFCFAICSIFYMLLIIIIFFSKEKLKNIENKIYSVLIITTFVGLIFEITSTVLELTGNDGTYIHSLFLKLIMVYYLTWIYIFFIYTYYISSKKNKINLKKYILVYIILFVIMISLPLYVKNQNGLVAYTYGPSVNFVYILSGILLTICIILMLKNFKQIKMKKYLPLLSFIVIGSGVSIIQFLFPDILLMSSLQTLVTVLMYFTIENPDLRMIEELNKNKMIIEKTSQGTSNFIFNLTTEIKKYINDVIKVCSRALQTNDKQVYQNTLQKLYSTVKEAENKINNVMDVSAIDIKNIKITNSLYDINKIFEELQLQYKSKIAEDIDFIVNISPNLPSRIYGDGIRLKQILFSLINNAIKYTDHGFIIVEANAIIKYDVCRLIISVEDSGKGIDLEKVNDILSVNEEINEVDIEQTNNLDLNLNSIKKLLKMLGGKLLISSTENKGTKIIVTLDQKFVSDVDSDLERRLSNYNRILGVRKVLIVDDDLKELTTLENYCNELNIDNICTMYGNDVLERTRIGQKFNLIIIDDAMNKMNALDILKALKANENFKTPVVIMLEEKKLSISKHYLADGFSDFIDKSRLDVEIKRIIDKYLN